MAWGAIANKLATMGGKAAASSGKAAGKASTTEKLTGWVQSSQGKSLLKEVFGLNLESASDRIRQMEGEYGPFEEKQQKE